jgi:hypothetical protein
MGKVNYTVLGNEIVRDPLELGYQYLNRTQIIEIINKPQFSEATINTDSENIRHAVTKVTLSKTSAKLAFLNVTDFVKRSRAELLFGPGTVITLEDLRLAVP